MKLILVLVLACPALAAAFSAGPCLPGVAFGRGGVSSVARPMARRAAHALRLPVAMAEFADVGGGGAVKKMVVEEGSGEVAQKGATVEVEYKGTIVENGWGTPQDVVECWLSSQQGMDVYKEAFIDGGVDGAKLLDLTEESLAGMGVSNKIHCKKLMAAVKRLQKQHEEVPVGAEFDSSEGKGPLSFKLGAGKVIKGWEVAVATMKAGEKAQVSCRADFAYGAEGLRKKTGEVRVPPFATLLFEMKLLKC
eukprot:CAMPEP_0206220546 /NCGR_PEP_ID=MMETSP0047_2-20121206/4938_1 /ASSEMBLY_ACC=CAM_ASM_000192 /TAXON_ID=195065 /ORGANISM="Chroomonas mesostigmatica_cf, Strain CCMP1168" /LENGTH=249 /DNA_ID=CAMNT_0053643219 /DNA_START=3 /DNA_END=753 /DNA_ORIENTATION=+